MYKEVGVAGPERPCKDRVYFLTRYLISVSREGETSLYLVIPGDGTGMLREPRELVLLAGPGEVRWYPGRVQVHDRAFLIRVAAEGKSRCTVFTGLDEHVTFVLDPDPASVTTITVYDVSPPLPTLSASIREIEACGLFGPLDVSFDHRVRDIREVPASLFPCRAAGFTRTLDRDVPSEREVVAGCLTSAQVLRECHGLDLPLHDTCPLSMVSAEPFLARCCRSERQGPAEIRGFSGYIIHWGAGPADILDAVRALAGRWNAGLRGSDGA